MTAGGVLALVHAVFSIRLRADQIVSGTAINLLAVGITGYLFLDHYGDQGTPDNISRAPDVTLPLVKSIPFVGDAIGKANLLTWLALIGVVALTVFLFRTPRGLRLRGRGRAPARRRDGAASPCCARATSRSITSGVLAAMGGAYLSIAFLGSFNQGMTAGRGFIALAAVSLRQLAPVRRARGGAAVRLLQRAGAAAARRSRRLAQAGKREGRKPTFSTSRRPGCTSATSGC